MVSMRAIREHCDGQRRLGVAFRAIEAEQRSADGGLALRGVAAVFDSPSEVLFGMFTERIKRGAFRNVLRTSPDVRLLVNHDGMPLARTTNGTLRLKETARGLEFEADLADTTQARDLHALIERGDITQMSFAFTVASDAWNYSDNENEPDQREIREVGELYEISAVTFPAYTATTAETVSLPDKPDDEQRDQAHGREQVAEAHQDTPHPPEVMDPRAKPLEAWRTYHSKGVFR